MEALDSGLVERGLVVPELGEVLSGDHPGRTSETEITLFRSLGLAVEDIASATLVYRRALERGLGTKTDFGG
jgi:ornithine cyclodeaminase/alanine dehydrogenase-like protein (mu-crystallin family)